MNNLHVCGVRLQAADDHADGGGQQVGDVPQHHTWRPGSRQDVIHKTQKGFCDKEQNSRTLWVRKNPSQSE